MTKDQKPREKKVDKIDVSIFSKTKEETRYLKKLVRMNLATGVVELGADNCSLCLLPNEVEIINETIDNLNIIRKSIGLTPLKFRLSRFHVLNAIMWDSMIRPKHPNASAIAAWGHCYLQRREFGRFSFDLTHEIGHISSYLSIIVLPGENTKYRMTTKHSGVCRLARNKTHRKCSGLSEGITELIAINLRMMAVRNSKILSCEERKFIKSHMSPDYEPLADMIMDLSRWLMKKEGADKTDPYMIMLLRDYFTGTEKFMRLCGKYDRRVVQIVQDIGTSPKEYSDSLTLLKTFLSE